MHILLIEDDLDLGTALQRALRDYGITSVWVRSLKDARDQTEKQMQQTFNCALLDLGLPDGQGLDLLKWWRKRKITLPVIILTAKDATKDRVTGLDEGADDYLIKPILPEEIASRIRAVTRRAGGHVTEIWKIGKIKIIESKREVYVDDEIVSLSHREFTILSELARRPGEVITKHYIARAITPLNDPVEINALEVHIHNLRKKIGKGVIRTFRGIGYGIIDEEVI
nr:response regulator transcription factor [uncultured Undibacterium sp.]